MARLPPSWSPGRRRWPWWAAVGLLVLVGAAARQEQIGWPGLAPWLLQRSALAPGLMLSPDTRVHLVLAPRLMAPELSLQRGGMTLLQARDLEVAWRWSDLWRWHREETALRLVRVQARYLDLDWRRDATGRSPWQASAMAATPTEPSASPSKPVSAPPSAPPSASSPVGASPPMSLPVIEQFGLEQGQAKLDDVPLRLQAQARFGSLDDGRWQAQVSGRLNGQALSLSATASAPLALVKPADAKAEPAAVQMTLTGAHSRVSFQGQAASLLDAQALDGHVQVSGASLQATGRPLGVTLPATAPFRLSARLRHSAGRWQLDDVQARVGASRLGGSFAFDTRNPRPQLIGLLSGGPLKLADLGPAVGTDRPPSRSGRVLPDQPMDLPALGAMDAQVAVRLSQLDFGTAPLAPLGPVQAELSLVRGRLELNDLQLGLEGGRIQGHTSLDGRVDPPLWQADLRVHDLPLERWLRGLRRSTPRAGESAALLSGQLQANAQLSGRGRSTAELLGSLDGPVSLGLRQGRLSHLVTEIAGLDIAQSLGVWLRGDDDLVLDCARVEGKFASGVLTPSLAVVDNSDSRILLSGQVDLRRERLALHATTLPKDFSPMSLRTPVEIGGTLAAPQVSLKAGPLGGRIAAAALLALAAPPAALLAFVDPGSPQPRMPCRPR